MIVEATVPSFWSEDQNTPETILEPLMGIWIKEPGAAPSYFFL
jgi:hypothetical protein